MNRVSRDVESRVINLHLKGFARDSIATQLHVSSATVSEILTILPPVLGTLRILSKELRKNGMIPQDVLTGVKILNDLKALGTKPEQYSASLKALIKMSIDTQYSPECVIQAATRLVELENESSKRYSEALKEFELITEKTCKKKRQNKRLKSRNLQMQSQIKEKKEQLAQLFKAADETPGDIAKFKKITAQLLQYNLNFDDVDIMNKLLKNLKEAGGDAKRIINLVKKVGSLMNKKAELKNVTKKTSHELAYIETQKKTAERGLRLKLNLNLELENKIRNMQSIIASQTRQIQMDYTQLCRIRADYERIDSLRREAINQIGKITGMNDHQIECLQLEASFHIISQDLRKRLEEFLNQRNKEFFKG